MGNKVKVKKWQLDRFRKLARETPLEIEAYLIGEIVSPELTVIDSFAYPKSYGTQTTTNVAWWAAEVDKLKRYTEERGRRIVGSIHSHPKWDAVLSPTDYKVCISEGLRVLGICSVNEGKTKARFWVMDSALPCDIVYAKSKQS